VGYLGLLSCFFIQLRWLPGWHGSLALALAIFVPKCGDIGAYFTGRFLGRHRMAPVLSPKKTWEGAAGGLLASVAVALGINAVGANYAPEGLLLPWAGAAGLGLVVGVVAMLGDLMESLIKRDCQRKDASELVPGFGGVLDVLDSVVFSAPVTYGWVTNFGSGRWNSLQAY
jgi:phosphatidate cytidylyltransferase